VRRLLPVRLLALRLHPLLHRQHASGDSLVSKLQSRTWAVQRWPLTSHLILRINNLEYGIQIYDCENALTILELLSESPHRAIFKTLNRDSHEEKLLSNFHILYNTVLTLLLRYIYLYWNYIQVV